VTNATVGTLRWFWVHAFLTLARCGSQTAASRQLGCSQPTVGANIRRLEHWLGFALGHGHSPYVLTEVGQAFVPLAKRVSRNIGRLRMDVDNGVKDFRFEWVDIFIVMRKYKSQIKCANQMGLSQVKVSREIINLENWIGYRLFERNGLWDITRSGEEFYSASDSMYTRLLNFRRQARDRFGREIVT
jgi:DNA-binding transcriptional LysR family regulator